MVSRLRVAASFACSAALLAGLGPHINPLLAGNTQHQLKSTAVAVVSVCSPCDMPDALVPASAPALAPPAAHSSIRADGESFYRARLPQPFQHNRAPPSV
jgi:hypothetical protein